MQELQNCSFITSSNYRLHWLNVTYVNGDVALYVRRKLQSDDFMDFSEEVKRDIEIALTDGSKGMFRWAQCQLEVIQQMEDTRPNIVREALAQLPNGIDNTYERILLDNSPSGQQLLRRALLILVYSARPIMLAEMAEFAVIKAGAGEIDPGDRFDSPERILRFCKSLVVTVGNHVSLAHYTVKEYLLSEKIRNGKAKLFALGRDEAELEISTICLTYLRLRAAPTYVLGHNLQDTVQDRWNCIHQLLRQYPFIEYAAMYWSFHFDFESQECLSICQPLLESIVSMKDGLGLWIWWLFKVLPLDRKVGTTSTIVQQRIGMAHGLCMITMHTNSNDWLGELKWRREEYFIGKGDRQVIKERMSIIIEDFNLYALGLLLLEVMIGSRICATSYEKIIRRTLRDRNKFETEELKLLSKVLKNVQSFPENSRFPENYAGYDSENSAAESFSEMSDDYEDSILSVDSVGSEGPIFDQMEYYRAIIAICLTLALGYAVHRRTSDGLKLVRLAISEASAYWYTNFDKSHVEMKIRTRARRTFDAEEKPQEDMQGTFRANYLESAVEEDMPGTLMVTVRYPESAVEEDMQGTLMVIRVPESAVEEECEDKGLQVLAKTTNNNTNDDNFEMLLKKLHRGLRVLALDMRAHTPRREV
ncbi:hypothetical protein BGZ57DRAFT_971246 [Hyaloscypha finlandica]|nr:hypothetical protein BGZ57DRAFT_971246 [Hyaloscypha finlandica]